MKIWSRIGPDQGNEQAGPLPPERYRSANPNVRFLRPFTVSIRERGQFNGARPLQAQPPSRQTVPTAKKFREIQLSGFVTVQRDVRLASRTLSRDVHFSGISNRFWPKNRSYRKQTIKPCLTGARTHIRRFGFLALFADKFHASNRRRRLKTERFFQSCSTTSNRNWPTNRSYRKERIKPSLTETRITRCDFGFLALFNAVNNREQRRFSATDVRPSLRRTCVTLAGETATNGLHRTYSE
jgi:hypothetical protein